MNTHTKTAPHNPLRLGYWDWNGTTWKAPRPAIPDGWLEHPEMTRYRRTKSLYPVVHSVGRNVSDFSEGRVYITGRTGAVHEYDYRYDPEAHFEDSGMSASGIGWPVRIAGTWTFRQVVSAEYASEHALRFRPIVLRAGP